MLGRADGAIACNQAVERLLINNQGRIEGVRPADGQAYCASKGVISNIDAQRLFLDFMSEADVQAIAPQLSDRLERRIVNDGIIKIDRACSEILATTRYPIGQSISSKVLAQWLQAI